MSQCHCDVQNINLDVNKSVTGNALISHASRGIHHHGTEGTCAGVLLAEAEKGGGTSATGSSLEGFVTGWAPPPLSCYLEQRVRGAAVSEMKLLSSFSP